MLKVEEQRPGMRKISNLNFSCGEKFFLLLSHLFNAGLVATNRELKIHGPCLRLFNTVLWICFAHVWLSQNEKTLDWILKRLWSLVSEPDLRKRDEGRVGSTGYPQFETPRTWLAVSLTGNGETSTAGQWQAWLEIIPHLPEPKISKNPTSQDYPRCPKKGCFPMVPPYLHNTWLTWPSPKAPRLRLGGLGEVDPPSKAGVETANPQCRTQQQRLQGDGTGSGRCGQSLGMWHMAGNGEIRKIWWFLERSSCYQEKRLEQMFGSTYFLLDKQVAVCCLAPNFLVTTDTKLN